MKGASVNTGKFQATFPALPACSCREEKPGNLVAAGLDGQR
jgi:hypothetical protein